MLLPKPVRKMIAVFRGGLSPQLIILSIAFGFSFGLIPGWTGIHTFIVILFLLMNVHTGLFLLSAGLGKSLCLAAAPLLYHLGGAAQDHLQLLLVLLGKIPIIGLTDFSTYSVVGAMIAGPVIGIIAGIFFAMLVMKFRSGWVKLEEGSDAYKKWTSKKWVKIIDRILIGKKTKDVRAIIEGKSPMLRKSGLAIAGIAVLVFVGAGFFVKDGVLSDYASKTLTKANGAEVNFASLALSPMSGAITATGIEVTNPEKPNTNQLAAEKFLANAGIYNLLCGKIVIDDIQMENLKLNTPRQKPGKIYESAKETDKPVEAAPSPADVDAGDVEKLEKYFKNAAKLKETLKKIRRFLPSGKKKVAEVKTVPESYLGYLKAKAPVTPVPRIIARNVSLEKVLLESEQFGLSNIKLTNISDAPVAFGEPVTIEVKSVDTDRSLNMEIDFKPDGMNAISGTFANFDLAILQSQMNDDNDMIIDQGQADGTFAGTISKDYIDITIDIDLKNLKAKSGDKGLFGLDAETTSEVFAAMDSLETKLRIFGPLTSPDIVSDLLKQLKKIFGEVSGKLLKSELKKQIDKNSDKIPVEFRNVIGEPEKILKGLGDLLGGDKKNKEKPADEKITDDKPTDEKIIDEELLEGLGNIFGGKKKK